MRVFSITTQTVQILDPEGKPTGATLRFETDAIDAAIMHLFIDDDKGNSRQINFTKQGPYLSEVYMSKDEEDELVEERIEAAEQDEEDAAKKADRKMLDLTDDTKAQIEAKARRDYKGGVRSKATLEARVAFAEKEKVRAERNSEKRAAGKAA